jgi:release factor glutamine methyltransferase
VLTPEELGALRALIKRRQAGESVAYLTGRKEFWKLEFAVDARVLVPRPDTETLIEEALARLGEKGEPGGPPPRIVDVGTGSGAIAITLAKLRTDAAVFATDVSAPALEVARANAERLAAAVTFVEGDLAAPLAAHAPFSLIVANLPYVPAGDLASLPLDVRTEPALALDGGADGLDLVRRLVADAPALLGSGAALALEIGDGQADATRALLGDAGFTDVQARKDLAGVERVVSGVKP